VLLLIIGAGGLLALRLAWPWLLALGAGRAAENTVFIPKRLREPLAAAQERAGSVKTCEVHRQILERGPRRVAKESCARNGSRWKSEPWARGDSGLVLFGAGSSGRPYLDRACSTKRLGGGWAPMGSTAVDCRQLQRAAEGFCARARNWWTRRGILAKQAQDAANAETMPQRAARPTC